jgi:hypothetical protein
MAKELEIKITGSGTKKDIAKALIKLASEIKTFNLTRLVNEGTFENETETLMTVIKEYEK